MTRSESGSCTIQGLDWIVFCPIRSGSVESDRIGPILASMTMMSNDILKIPKAIRLARRTRNKIIVNIIFSVVTKGAILALAIAGHPLLWANVIADVGTCLLVILNSIMLLQTSVPKVEKKCHRSSHAENEQGDKHTSCCAKIDCDSADRAPSRCQNYVHSPVNVDQCSSGGDTKAPDRVSCCQEVSRNETNPNHEHIMSAACQHNDHNAHEHKIQKSGRITCCTRATNRSHDHVVVIGCAEEHYGSSGHKKCNSGQVNKVDGCDRTVSEKCGKRDCCSSSPKVGAGQKKDGCCKSKTKKCGVTGEKKENVDCCRSDGCGNAGEKIKTGITCARVEKRSRGVVTMTGSWGLWEKTKRSVGVARLREQIVDRTIAAPLLPK